MFNSSKNVRLNSWPLHIFKSPNLALFANSLDTPVLKRLEACIVMKLNLKNVNLEILTFDCRFGQFLVSTLPTGNLTEKNPDFKDLKSNNPASAPGENASGMKIIVIFL